MQKAIRSFAVGACVRQGSFLAFLLKLRFDDGHEILTAWPKPQIPLLLRMLLEYQGHLHQVGGHVDPYSIEKTIRTEAPNLSTAEIENLQIESVVEIVEGKIRTDRILVISIRRAKQQEYDSFLVVPNQCEWLIGFTLNTLNEFDEDGGLSVPEGWPH